jgi:hypothetical protein
MHLMAQLSSPQLFLLALFATSGLMLYHAHRRWQRVAAALPKGRCADLGERRPRGSSPGVLRVNQSEVHAHELARETSAQIDSKLTALEHLMRAAQQETQRLEAAIAKARATGLPPPL